MNENLTPKQRRAVEALLTNWDTTQAAQAAGVSRDTLYRWMREERFRAALNDATRQALEGLSRSLIVLGDKAARTLEEALDAFQTPTGAKVRAADIVLSRILQLRELVDLEARVTELERGRK